MNPRLLLTLFLTGTSLMGPGAIASRAGGDDLPRFELADVFELEYAADPQISPDGQTVVYERRSMDIMIDKVLSRLWTVDVNGKNHRPLTAFGQNASTPRFSPDGKRLAYVARNDGRVQVFVRWLDTGQTARLTNLSEAPKHISWSPDGRQLAFTMLVPAKQEPYVEMPATPEGAQWAESPKVIDTLVYRSDGDGYLKDGYSHLFVLPAEGGTPRQLTHGSFHHEDRPVWTPDGEALIFSANRQENWEHEPLNSDLYRLALADGEIEALTDRVGPDHSPDISRDGSRIAFLGYDDRGRSYHQTELYVMDRDGSNRRCVTEDFDFSVGRPRFSADQAGVYFQYDEAGNTKIGYVSLADAKFRGVAANVGGTTLGRPYASGSFSLARNGRVAFTQTSPTRPADVAVSTRRSGKPRRLTQLNDDLLGHKQLADVEPFWFTSSHDGKRIQGWIVKPPGFDAKKKYPLILEIHGGPFANYGDRFSAEIQLYAAAGYVVLYVNPRGSTSYGHDFAALIDQNYPSEDYDDLMSGVDAVMERGYVDPERLCVTGGSGGGVLSSWIVGKTDRFRAAVVAKPVINWYSFVLTADHYNYFARYWFGKYPWEDPEAYLKRSSISLVGNVTTPTMLLTGEVDYRTPISESEQFYQALKLRKVDTILVRVPDASHGIAARPSHLIAKVAHVLKWFETHAPE